MIIFAKCAKSVHFSSVTIFQMPLEGFGFVGKKTFKLVTFKIIYATDPLPKYKIWLRFFASVD